MPTLHRELAPAKLTLELRVVGRRDDGFHLIEAEMVSLDLFDCVEIGVGDDLSIVDEVEWIGGNPAPLDVPLGQSNLVTRALRLVGAKAAVRLVKKIPPGSGLGGGSADAAAIFRWAGFSDLEVAAKLGADVPFCMRGGRALVRGVGEVIEPLDPVARSFVLLTPNIVVSTAKVYSAFDELTVGSSTRSRNDLERAALAVEPRLATWRKMLESVSGIDPVLAGSGSTFFVECDSSERALLASEVAEAVRKQGAPAMVTPCTTSGRAGERESASS